MPTDELLGFDKDGNNINIPIQAILDMIGSSTPIDTEAPTTPSSLQVTSTNGLVAGAFWTASSDNSTPISYELEYKIATELNWANGTSITVQATSHNINLPQAGTYDFRVRAKDPSNNYSGYSNEIQEVFSIPASSTKMYYGQAEPATILNQDFFQVVDNSADDVLTSTSTYTLGKNEITGQEIIAVPFFGDPFTNVTELNKNKHFFALPPTVGLVSSVNARFTSDVFYSNGGVVNVYSTSTITVGGVNYTIWELTLNIPLGGDVTVSVQTL